MNNMSAELKRAKDWRFMPVGKDRGFFLCLGGTQTYKYNKGKWVKMDEELVKLQLMNNTLVYGDLVEELYISGAKHTSMTALHIIDALVLGSKDIRMLPFNERYDLITKYSSSLNKLSRHDLAPIRAKISYELSLEHMQTFLKRLKKWPRGDTDVPVCPVDVLQARDAVYVPHGILFMKVLKENFAAVDFRFCLQNRVFWRTHSDIDLQVPDDLTTYNPRPQVLKMDENGEEKPLVHAASLLRHLSTISPSPGVAQLN